MCVISTKIGKVYVMISNDGQHLNILPFIRNERVAFNSTEIFLIYCLEKDKTVSEAVLY